MTCLRFAEFSRMFRIGTLAAVLAISGCSSVSQIFQDPRVVFMGGSSTDSCAILREPFVEVREKQRKQVFKWAAAGAWIGATSAVLSKDKSKGKFFRRTVGGALLGAVTGYYADLKKRESQTGGLRNTIFTDAKADANGGDKLVAGVSKLNACRMKSLDDIAAGLQSGALSKEDAHSSLAVVKSRTQLDNKLIESVSEGLTKRSKIYVGALQLSGADDADKYISEAEAYKPIVRKPKYAVSRKATSRPAPKPITIKKRPKKNENSVTATANGAAELDAMVVAHVQSVDEAIENIESILL